MGQLKFSEDYLLKKNPQNLCLKFGLSSTHCGLVFMGAGRMSCKKRICSVDFHKCLSVCQSLSTELNAVWSDI